MSVDRVVDDLESLFGIVFTVLCLCVCLLHRALSMTKLQVPPPPPPPRDAPSWNPPPTMGRGQVAKKYMEYSAPKKLLLCVKLEYRWGGLSPVTTIGGRGRGCISGGGGKGVSTMTNHTIYACKNAKNTDKHWLSINTMRT